MAHKQDRVAVSIMKYVSDIIQFKLNSPEIGFVTVTSVELTNDLSYAKIYVSYIIDNCDQQFEALQKQKGFVRSELAKKLTIRKVPNLIFVKDTSFEKGQKIENLLKDIKKESEI